MIVNFKHKGLENFFLKGDGSKLQSHHLKRIRLILTTLDNAESLNDINVPGFQLHQLKGKLKGVSSVSVNGNYRITFRFDEKKIEVLDIDYLDYHK